MANAWIEAVGACLFACVTIWFFHDSIPRWHCKQSHDCDQIGVQKIVETPIPRVGGIGVLASLVYSLAKRISVRSRLFAAFISAAVADLALDAKLTDLVTPGLDYLISFGAVSFLFTCFAVGGMTNAVNIIDGLNGLAPGSVALMLGGLAGIAWAHGDTLVMKLCLWGIAASMGFLIINYQYGKIFLGDGGAYLAGFWLAECSILMLQRNPEVSTWSILLAVIYPVWETVFSMYRRRIRDGVETGQADLGHMHQLLYRRLHHEAPGKTNSEWFRHGVASASIWATVLGCQVIAALASQSTVITCIAVLAYATGYVWMYWQLNPRSKDSHQAIQAANI